MGDGIFELFQRIVVENHMLKNELKSAKEELADTKASEEQACLKYMELKNALNEKGISVLGFD